MKLTLGNKIALACGLPIVLAVALGSVSITSITGIESLLLASGPASLPGSIQLAELSRASAEQATDMLKHIMASAGSDAQTQCDSDIAAWESRFQNGLQSYGSKLSDAGESGLFDHIRQTHENFLSEWSGAIQPLSRAGKEKEAFAKWGVEMVPTIEAERQATESGLAYERQAGAHRARAAAHMGQSALLWSLVLLLLATVGGISAACAVARSLRRVLLSMVNDLCRGAGQVASAANQISSSSQSLAQGTSEQAASLEQTSASTEEMTSMTRKNAENAEDCAKLMAAVDARITEANQTLDEMVTSMEQINASSDKISRIIKVIEEIAFQTNILALNAAVEAARAGEAGMGFAVVAGEVRNLAQRSSQAAKDTAVLIEESIEKSNGGTARVSQVADAIQAIAESANKVKLLVDEVNLGSQEQARGMAQIAEAVIEIERVTQRAAAGSEQTASASEELSAQAESIRGLVEGMRQLAGGGDGFAGKPPTRPRPHGALSAIPVPRSHIEHRPELAGAATKTSREQIPLDGDFQEF